MSELPPPPSSSGPERTPRSRSLKPETRDTLINGVASLLGRLLAPRIDGTAPAAPSSPETGPKTYSERAARESLMGVSRQTPESGLTASGSASIKKTPKLPKFDHAGGFRAADRDTSFVRPTPMNASKDVEKRSDAGQFTGKRYVSFETPPPMPLDVRTEILDGVRKKPNPPKNRPTGFISKHAGMRASLRRDAINKRAAQIAETEMLYGTGIGDNGTLHDILENGDFTLAQKTRMNLASMGVRSNERSIARITKRLEKQAGYVEKSRTKASRAIGRSALTAVDAVNKQGLKADRAIGRQVRKITHRP